jgi:hypothetical protein
MLFKLFLLAVAAKEASSCARHDNHQRHPHLGRRQTITTDPGRPETDWRYEASFNWGLVNSGKSSTFLETPGYPLAQDADCASL